MNRKLIAGAFITLCVVVLLAAFALGGRNRTLITGTAGQAVGVVNVEGVILGGQGGLFGGGASAGDIMRQLRGAREDTAVKAVVLRVNSPGGSAAASQEIADEIKKVREAGKPVVTSMGDTAASGGYWIAAATDRIVANPATLTGSIGVIMELQNLQGLYDKLGIDFNVIKSGPHKDMGSTSRDLTREERDILQGMVDDIYQQFVAIVADGRNLPVDQVKKLADGRVFTGRQAKELGLVDSLGNYYEAVRVAADLAGIEGEPEIRSMTQPRPWEWLFSSLSAPGSWWQLLPGIPGGGAQSPLPGPAYLLINPQ